MADSIPSLRRKLDEANAEIARLKEAITNRPVNVVERIVDREVPIERIVYKEVPVEVEVPGPEVVKYVDRVVEVPVEKLVRTTDYIEYPVIEYVDNPEHIKMIEELHERLRALQPVED